MLIHIWMKPAANLQSVQLFQTLSSKALSHHSPNTALSGGVAGVVRVGDGVEDKCARPGRGPLRRKSGRTQGLVRAAVVLRVRHAGPCRHELDGAACASNRLNPRTQCGMQIRGRCRLAPATLLPCPSTHAHSTPGWLLLL